MHRPRGVSQELCSVRLQAEMPRSGHVCRDLDECHHTCTIKLLRTVQMTALLREGQDCRHRSRSWNWTLAPADAMCIETDHAIYLA